MSNIKRIVLTPLLNDRISIVTEVNSPEVPTTEEIKDMLVQALNLLDRAEMAEEDRLQTATLQTQKP
jgi:hypothetical protein